MLRYIQDFQRAEKYNASMVRDSIYDWLEDTFTLALQQRSRLKIEKRLKAADETWNDADTIASNCKGDAGINHLKKKIWTLYSIITAQLVREGQEAIELEAIEPTIKDLSGEIANELMDDMVTSINEVDNLSIETFLEAVNVFYRRNANLVSRAARSQLDELEGELRLTMLNGDQHAEMLRLILDFCMYPNCFMLAAYKVKEEQEDITKGRITTYTNESYSFHRLNPWSVFPVDNTPKCKQWFVIEEYCAQDLEKMKGSDGVHSSNMDAVIKDHNQYSHKWYRARYKNYPEYESDTIPVVKYFGHIPEEQTTTPGYGEVWFVGDKIIYESIGKDDTAVVLSASFRHNNDSVWGTGMVDIGWRIQKTIDALSEMQIANIGFRAKPGGIVPATLAKYIKDSDGGKVTKIKYDRFYTVPDEVIQRGLRVNHFEVPDRSFQIQQAIEAKKADMDSLLGIPAFVDGSSNVGTLGRTSGGLFLVQKNMMQNVESVWRHFANEILVKLAQRIINGMFLQKSYDLYLDFKVIVRPFYYIEEDLEDADSMIKKVSALLQLAESGQISPEASRSLAEKAALKLGADEVEAQQQTVGAEPEQQQIFG